MNTEKIFQQVMNENCKDPLHRFAQLVRQDEREACAKLCESEGHRIDASWESCAVAIRGRTE
jgi:hypothetical protein